MRKRKNSAKRKALEIASQTHRAYHNSIQIEDYLRQNIKQGSRTFFLEVKDNGLDALGVEIRPMLDKDPNNVYVGYVMRFNIEPRRAIDNMVKFLREKTNDRIEV
jgi:type III secretory pathway component EscV